LINKIQIFGKIQDFLPYALVHKKDNSTLQRCGIYRSDKSITVDYGGKIKFTISRQGSYGSTITLEDCDCYDYEWNGKEYRHFIQNIQAELYDME